MFNKENIRSLAPALLSDEQLLEALEALNRAYRQGTPWISDAEYDHLWIAELRDRNPNHPFLHRVEPEPAGTFSGEIIHHSIRMLSTDKAYDRDKLQRFFNRCRKAADQLGLPAGPLTYAVQPKLDGLSGRLYPGRVLATRGDDGWSGQNVSKALDRGLRIIGDVEEGSGEIVVLEEYFQEVLHPKGYAHPRNFMVGFCGADTPSADHVDAAQSGALHFMPYNQLETIYPFDYELIERIDTIFEKVTESCPYRTDGIVISILHSGIRNLLGATDHHYRWQIAFKKNQEGVRARATTVVLQTGRTGIVTPVVHLEPVQVSGAIIRKASGHNAAKLEEDGIGPGAVLRIVRSGEVIPTIVGVEEPSPTPVTFTHCPSCGTELVSDGRFRRCPATDTCPAQSSGGIYYFFQTIHTGKGFGKKVCATLAQANLTIPDILAMGQPDFESLGITPGIAANLADAVATAKQTPVSPERLLAAMGIPFVGETSARKLIESIGDIRSILEGITAEKIAAIRDFGEITANAITDYIDENRVQLLAILDAGIPLRSERPASTGPLAGQYLVFTGTFSRPRTELEALAAAAGAIVQSSVTKQTTKVYVGDKPGATKLQKAAQLGIPQASETDFPL